MRKMEQTVQMEIPRQWLAGVPDEPMTLQQIFRLGLYQYRLAPRCRSTKTVSGPWDISQSSSSCPTRLDPRGSLAGD